MSIPNADTVQGTLARRSVTAKRIYESSTYRYDLVTWHQRHEHIRLKKFRAENGTELHGLWCGVEVIGICGADEWREDSGGAYPPKVR